MDDQLADLNQKTSDLERNILAAESKADKLAKQARVLARRELCLRLAEWLRTAGGEFEFWQLGVMVVLPLAVSGCAFTLLYVISDWLTLSFGLTVPIFLASAISTAILLFRGDTLSLIQAHDDAVQELSRTRREIARSADSLHAAKNELESVVAQRAELVASARFKRDQLLKENWKAMRDVEWEKYLARVLEALGASVEMTKTTGDQGVDLIANFGDRRIAIQAKGYYHSVNNGAVQEVVAGMLHYRCHRCAVITNSRFTRSARDLARSNGCTLIGEHNFPQFVRGEREL